MGGRSPAFQRRLSARCGRQSDGVGVTCPIPAGEADPKAPQGMLGDVWEWTESAYSPYPGFETETGAVGEYNGKFMINQVVLRGASCATAPGHARITYRNFFYRHQRWAFAGFRLAA
jgi:formylglycine-generating enzyme required for sulfatase activity